MDKLFVTIGGVGLIGFIWWFFFGGKKDHSSHKAMGGQGKDVDHDHH